MVLVHRFGCIRAIAREGKHGSTRTPRGTSRWTCGKGSTGPRRNTRSDERARRCCGGRWRRRRPGRAVDRWRSRWWVTPRAHARRRSSGGQAARTAARRWITPDADSVPLATPRVDTPRDGLTSLVGVSNFPGPCSCLRRRAHVVRRARARALLETVRDARDGAVPELRETREATRRRSTHRGD